MCGALPPSHPYTVMHNNTEAQTQLSLFTLPRMLQLGAVLLCTKVNVQCLPVCGMNTYTVDRLVLRKSNKLLDNL
jgi:hypothetical protein